MNLLDVTPKALPDFVLERLNGSWVPNENTTKWTTGDAGGYIRGPLTDLLEVGINVTKADAENFAARIRADLDARGVLKPAMLDPDFHPEPGAHALPNPWDPMHFSIAILRELRLLGFSWASNYAYMLVESYRRSKVWRHLNRTWAPGTKPFDTNGRPRNAGRSVQAWTQIYDILLVDGADGGTLQYVANECAKAVTAIVQNMPLYAEPKGDHLPDENHLEVFIEMTMVECLDLMRKSRIAERLPAHTIDNALAISKQIIHLCELALYPEFAVADYDLGWDVENKRAYSSPVSQKNHGAGSVLMWCYRPMRRHGSADAQEWCDELRDQAKSDLKNYKMMCVEQYGFVPV